MIFELAQDFRDALAAMPEDNPKRRTLELLEEAIRRDIHFIARHATTLFQCMWNSCWWYDCPEAAGHYELPSLSASAAIRRCIMRLARFWVKRKIHLSLREPPWLQRGPKLHRVLEAWRIAKETTTPPCVWIRLLRPQAIALGAGQVMVFRGHEMKVTGVAVFPDGQRIASASVDRTVRVWDAESGAMLRCLQGHQQSVLCLAVSPDGHQIATSSFDFTIRIWDGVTGEELMCLHDPSTIADCLTFSPDGTSIVGGSPVDHVGKFCATVRAWDIKTGEATLCLTGHKEKILSVAMSPDGTRLVSGSTDKTVRLWDTETKTECCCLRGHSSEVNTVAFSHDGRLVVSGSFDGSARIWSVATGKEERCLCGPNAPVGAAAFLAHGRRVVTASGGDPVFTFHSGEVRVWEAKRGRMLGCFSGHEGPIESLAVFPDGRRIVTGSSEGTLRIWDTEANRDSHIPCCHITEVVGIAYSPDGRKVASWSHDAVIVWDAATGTKLASLNASLPASMAFSPNSRFLVGGFYDGSVCVWDTEDASIVRRIGRMDLPVLAVTFSPDGRRVAGGTGVSILEAGFLKDRIRVYVWDLRTGERLCCMRGHTDDITNLTFLQDGHLIRSVSKDRTARVWDTRTRRCLDVAVCNGSIKATALPEQLRFEAQPDRMETILKDRTDGTPAGWFPDVPAQILYHPSGSSWAGACANQLCLVTMKQQLES